MPEDMYVARTYRDAPDIDGCVFFHAPYEILSGTIVSLVIIAAHGYDLVGQLCGEECVE